MKSKTRDDILFQEVSLETAKFQVISWNADLQDAIKRRTIAQRDVRLCEKNIEFWEKMLKKKREMK